MLSKRCLATLKSLHLRCAAFTGLAADLFGAEKKPAELFAITSFVEEPRIAHLLQHNVNQATPLRDAPRSVSLATRDQLQATQGAHLVAGASEGPLAQWLPQLQ